MQSQMRQSVDKTFEALFLLEDLRQVWRDTAPLHKLTPEQKSHAQKILCQVKECVDEMLSSVEQ